MRRILLAVLIVVDLFTFVHLLPFWHDNVALWGRVTATSPTYARGWVNLGSAAYVVGDSSAADTAWRRARQEVQRSTVPRLERQVVLSTADQDLGLLASRRGDLSAAAYYFDESLTVLTQPVQP